MANDLLQLKLFNVGVVVGQKKVMSSTFSSKKNYIKSPYRENMYPVWTMDMDVVLYGREFVCPLNQEDVASGFLL